MRKALYLVFFLTTLNISSQESNIKILQKSIDKLNDIESVFYTSKFEANENEITYSHSEDSIFFLFDNFNKSKTPKYIIKNKESELIFDGKDHIQSMVKEKVIVTGGARNPNNPLLLTLFPIRELLPQLINNENVVIERKDDVTFNGQKNFVFDVILKNRVIDWEQLNINTLDIAAIKDKTYTVIINKSNYLPSKIIMPNGPTGSMSRTFENYNFDYQVDERTWIGELLPENYTRITLEDYFKQMREKMTLQSKESQADSAKLKLYDWKIPNLETDKLVDFSQFRGKVVLLEFWFMNCGPCLKAVPDLNELSKKYKKDDFLLYGVEFVESYPRNDLQKYVSKIKIDYPVLYKGKELAGNYSVQAAPTFMILDKEGKIVYFESGFDKEKIETIIKENL